MILKSKIHRSTLIKVWVQSSRNIRCLYERCQQGVQIKLNSIFNVNFVLLVQLIFFSIPMNVDGSNAPPGVASVEPVVQNGHAHVVSNLKLSDDGSRMITGSFDNTAILWDTATGKKLRTFSGHTQYVTDVDLSPDGRIVATASYDNTAIVWESSTSKILRTLSHSGHVVSVALSADAKYVVTGTDEGDVILWSVSTGEKTRQFRGPKKSDGRCIRVASIALSESGSHLAAGFQGGGTFVWDLVSKRAPRSFVRGDGFETDVDLSADGRHLVTVSFDRKAVLWDTSTGKIVREFPGHTDFVNCAAICGDGKRLVTGSSDNTAILWDLETGKKLHVFKHSARVSRIDISSNGHCMVTVTNEPEMMSRRDKILIWDFKSRKQQHTISGNRNKIMDVAVTPDNGQVAIVGYRAYTKRGQPLVWLWQAGTGMNTCQVTPGLDVLQDVEFIRSNDQFQMWVASNNGVLKWKTPTGKPSVVFGRNVQDVRRIASSSNNQFFASVAPKDTVTVWSADHRKLHTLRHPDTVMGIAFNSNGKFLATALTNGDATIWDTSKGEKIRTFSSDGRLITSVTLDDSGKYLVTGTAQKVSAYGDGNVVLWDIDSGKKVKTFARRKSWVTSVAMSRDGKSLVVGSGDGLLGFNDHVAVLVQLPSGKELHVLSGHTAAITSVKFCNDDRFVITGSFDGTTRLWDVTSGKKLCKIVFFDGSDDWLAITPDGLFDGSEGGIKKVEFREPGTINFVSRQDHISKFHSPGLLGKIFGEAANSASAEGVR